MILKTLFWKQFTAVAGGITAVFEMPNTIPPTSNLKEFQRKLELAKNCIATTLLFWCNSR